MKTRGNVFNALDDKVNPPVERRSLTGSYDVIDGVPRFDCA